MSMMSVLYMTKVLLNLLGFKRIMKHGERGRQYYSSINKLSV